MSYVLKRGIPSNRHFRGEEMMIRHKFWRDLFFHKPLSQIPYQLADIGCVTYDSSLPDPAGQTVSDPLWANGI